MASAVAASFPARRFDTTDFGTCSFIFDLDGVFGLAAAFGLLRGRRHRVLRGQLLRHSTALACLRAVHGGLRFGRVYGSLQSLAFVLSWHPSRSPWPPLVMGIFFRLPSAQSIEFQVYGHGHDSPNHGHRCLRPLRSPLHSLQWRRLWHSVIDVAGTSLLTLQISSHNRH